MKSKSLKKFVNLKDESDNEEETPLTKLKKRSNITIPMKAKTTPKKKKTDASPTQKSIQDNYKSIIAYEVRKSEKWNERLVAIAKERKLKTLYPWNPLKLMQLTP